MTKLQVLIAAKGKESIERIASLPHPEMQEVEYIVSWQDPGETIPESLKNRKDFKIIPTDTIGLSNNRNLLMEKATADLVLISDDDLSYTADQLKAVIKAFEENPEESVLTFRYSSENNPRLYPTDSFNLKSPPKGYYFCSIEIAFNLKQIEKIAGKRNVLRFNPYFGLNGKEFIAGEEDILITELLRNGHSGKYIPIEITSHPGTTTASRHEADSEYIATKGAVMIYLKPCTWPLRMLTHAWRSNFKGSGSVRFFTYCRWWLDGVSRARKNQVFKN